MTLPSNYAGPTGNGLKIPTPDNSEIYLDLHEWPDSIIRPLALVLVEKGANGTWDFMTGTNYTSIWYEDEDNQNEYHHPDGTVLNGSMLDILNHYGYRMVTDYAPRINQLLASRFAQVAVPASGGTLTPFPFATIEQARGALDNSLGSLLAPQLGADGVPRVLVKAA